MLYADSCSCNASDEDSTIKLVCIGAGIPPCECNEEHCEVSILMSIQNELCYDLTHYIVHCYSATVQILLAMVYSVVRIQMVMAFLIQNCHVMSSPVKR